MEGEMTDEKTTEVKNGNENMKKSVKIFNWIAAIIIAVPVLGFMAFMIYASQPEAKLSPECLVSDKLRVQIGDRVFAFPREIVFSIAGNDYEYVSTDHYATGSEICQRKDAPAIKTNGVSIDVIPLACSDEKDCGGKRIKVGLKIHDGESSSNLGAARCLTAIESTNPLYIYGGICRMMFNDKGLDYWIQFRNGEKVYPAENIDNTEKMVIQEVEEMEITNKISSNKE